MEGEVPDRETATEIAEAFAREDERCVGEFGTVLDVDRDDGTWIVDFRTHTLSDELTHRIRITSAAGNVVSYERESTFD